MSLVQASCMFNIEFVKFYNIDLFHQGLYQVRAFLRPDPGQHSRGVPLCHVQMPELIASSPPDDPTAIYQTAQVVSGSQSSASSGGTGSTANGGNPSTSTTGDTGGSRDSAQYSACSKTLYVQFTDQAEWLGDTFRQRVTWQCDVHRVVPSVVQSPLHLTVQLYWMSTKNIGTGTPSSSLQHGSSVFDTPYMKLASERDFVVHYHPDRGLHHHFHVLFNYQNLCAVEMQLHGVLCDISPCHFVVGRLPSPAAPPSGNRFLGATELQLSHSASGGSVSLTSSPRQKNNGLTTSVSSQHLKASGQNNGKVGSGPPVGGIVASSSDVSLVQERRFIYKSWNSILFSARSQAKPGQQAAVIHYDLCRILLSAHECLLNTFCDLAEKLPLGMKIDLERKDCRFKFQRLTRALMESMDSEEDLADLVTVHISKLASENVALFDQFTETFSGQRHSVLDLMRVRSHWKRMRRFAEGFFTRDYPMHCLISLYDRTAGYETIAQMVRQSEYFSNLTPLQMECFELDGDATTLPIIFEDVYTTSEEDSQPAVISSTSLVTLSTNLQSPDTTDGDSAFSSARSTTKKERRKSNSTLDSLLPRKSSSAASTPSSSASQYPALLRAKLDEKASSVLSEQQKTPRSSLAKGSAAKHRDRAKDKVSSGVALIGYRKVVEESPGLDLPLPTSSSVSPVSMQSTISGSPSSSSIHSKTLVSPSSSSTAKALLSDASPIPSPSSHLPPPSTSGSNSSAVTPPQTKTISLGTLAFPNPPEMLLSRATAMRGVYSSVKPTLLDTTGRLNSLGATSSLITSSPLKSDVTDRGGDSWSTSGSKRRFKLFSGFPRRKESKSNNNCNTGVDLNLPQRSHAKSMPNLLSTSPSVSSSLSSLEQGGGRFLSARKRKKFNNLNYPTTTELFERVLNLTTPDSEVDRAALLRQFTATAAGLELDGGASSGSSPQPQHHKLPPSRVPPRIAASQSMWELSTPDSLMVVDGASGIRGDASEHSISSFVVEEVLEDSEKTPMSAEFYPGDQSSKASAVNEAAITDRPVEDPHAPRRHASVSAADRLSPLTSPRTEVAKVADSESADTRMTFLEMLKMESGSQRNSVRKVPAPNHAPRRKVSAQCIPENGSMMCMLPESDTTSSQDPKSPTHRHSVAGVYNSSSSTMLACGLEWPEAPPLKLLPQATNQQSHEGQNKDLGLIESSSSSLMGSTASSLYTGDEASTTPGCYGQSLVPQVSNDQVVFVKMKFDLKKQLAEAFNYHGQLYSDLGASHAFSALRPYFSDTVLPPVGQDKVHLIVCVHGLEGNESDLRLAKVYLELALCQPACGESGQWDFLMSTLNRGETTFAELDILSENLVKEINCHILAKGYDPYRISFIGHSMGAVLVRAVLTSPGFQQWVPRLHTFLSLSGPHLGTIYNRSSLVNIGLWLMRRVKKGAGSLQQLSLMDRGTEDGQGSTQDLRKTYMYRLSQQPGLDLFQYVLLVSSPQDRYVPYHSSRIELCREAVRGNSELGRVYAEMVGNIWHKVLHSPKKTKLVRYDVYHALSGPAGSSSTNRWIGRAAHIAVLDSELFLEKLMGVSVAKYFSTTS